MMKRLLAICLFGTALVSAEGTWDLHGELIVWEPCSRSFVFAHVAAAVPNRNSLFIVKPNYNAGFRVGIGRTSSSCLLTTDLTYTYWKGRSTRSVRGNLLRLEVPNFSLNLIGVDGRRQFEYQEVDLSLRRFLSCQCSFQIDAIGGIRFLYLRANERASGFQAPPSTVITISQADKFTGFAFEGGFSLRRFLCWHLDLKGELLALVGAGCQTNRWAVLSGAGAGISSYGGSVPSSFNCLTGMEANVSLGRVFCYRCFDLTAEVGYEILHYVDVLRHVEPISEDAYALPTYSSGFQGPFLKLSACF